MASGAAETDFSQLPSDLLCSIGDKLDLAVDRVLFRSTCKSWRSSVHPPFPRPPWLFLSDFQDQIQTIDNCLKELEGGPDDNRNLDEESLCETEEVIGQIETEEKEGVVNCSIPPCRRPRSFVGIGDQQIYELDLPEAYQTRCIGSTGNWLITIDLLGIICLLNPFSRVQVYLPPHSTFRWDEEEYEEGWDATPNLRRDASLRKTILSSSSPNKKDCIAIAIYDGVKKLAIARPGDASWIDIDCPTTRAFDDIIIYKEQLYGVNIQGTVVVCDNITSAFDDDCLHSPPKASVLMDRFQIPNIGDPTIMKYLVEWLGELLLVIKFVKTEYVPIPSYNTTSFKIYKLDFANKKWDELNSLGDYSLFLGFNKSISILASNYSTWVKKNCIYFTDDYTFGYRGSGVKGGHDMGVFDVETNSIQPHYEGISLSFYSPPIWIVPTAPSKVPINSETQGGNATLHHD